MSRVTSASNLSLLVVVVGALGCEPSGPTYDVTVDTFNVALAGAFIPHEAERRQPIADAIASMTSDVVCLQEVWRQSDKDLIVEAAREAFPYAVSFEHDLDTEVDDPRDQTGEVPTPFATPPCAETSLAETLEGALGCLADNCSTIPGSEEGRTTSTDCAQDACVSFVSSLLLGDEASLRCYACLATGLPTETISDIRDLCTTEVNGELAFHGQSGVVLLSAHPLRDASATVLPGTWNRRIVARATVELPEDLEVDVYCNHLTPIFDAVTYPYTGLYGEGQVNDLGWEAEQRLQIGRLADQVEEESGSGPAVLLGDFNTGGDFGDDIVAEGAANFDLLQETFTLGVAPGYEPLCTMCPDSPNRTEDSDAVWIDHVFLWQIPASAVLSTERTFTDNIVEVEGDPSLVPLSDHYGLRSTIRLE